jgi:hypothetical protein
MRYPIIKEGLYILKTNNEHKCTQTISILQIGTYVEISFFNSFIEKNVSIKGSWILNEQKNGYNLHITNSYNNKKMVFYIDKSYNDYFTLKGRYEDNNNYIFLIEK